MKKVCPVCQTTLKTNCFIKDNGISTLSYLELIIKDDDFKKTNYELKSCYCPNCGHVEIILKKIKMIDHKKYNKKKKSYDFFFYKSIGGNVKPRPLTL